jgi:hypothetical protein
VRWRWSSGGGQREISEMVTPCWTQMDESTGKGIGGLGGRAKALGWGQARGHSGTGKAAGEGRWTQNRWTGVR